MHASSVARALQLDLRIGRTGLIPTLLAASVAGASSLIACYASIGTSGVSITDLSFADNLAIMLGGSRPFEFRPGVFFIPPLGWLLLIMLMLYLPLSYPYRDLAGIGQQILIREGSRRTWWLSKCLWVLCMEALAYLTIGGVALAWTASHGQPIELTIHASALQLLNVDTNAFTATYAPSVSFIASSTLALSAYSLLQLSLSLIVRPSVAYFCTLALCIASAYVQTPLLLGSYLMAVRWGDLVATGVDPVFGVFFAVMVGTASSIIGAVAFSRMDVVQKELSA